MRGRPVPKEAILENLRAVAKALGKKVLMMREYAIHPLALLSMPYVKVRFGSWGNAVVQAGLEPGIRGCKTPEPPMESSPRPSPLAQSPSPAPQDGGCPRCCGLFELVNILDGNGIPMQQWRCVNCGEVLDDKIRENRRLCQPKEKRLHGQWPPPAPEKHNRRLGAVAL
jgi:hypothetical protein